ncbi:MAG: 50S ribosomal protein L27 [bacterium]|nr:50S ribosomal protein L27 [bacterium]
MAHKKAAGSTQNVRDSQSKRRGIKRFGGQVVIPGNIIVRQKGTQWFPGQGVDMGRDFTIYATREGVVTFTEKRQKKFNGQTHYDTIVHVMPAKTAA